MKEGEIRNEIETVTKAGGGGGKMIGNAFFLPSQFLSVWYYIFIFLEYQFFSFQLNTGEMDFKEAHKFNFFVFSTQFNPYSYGWILCLMISINLAQINWIFSMEIGKYFLTQPAC